MPINPLIASGGTPFDVSNALFKMGDGQRQDRAVQVAEERNALVDRRWQAQDAQQQAALAKEAEEDAAFDAARLKGDWDAMAAIDPDTTKVLWQFQEARKPPVQPGPIQTQRMPDGATFYTQDGKSIGSRMPQAPQQGPGATAEMRNWQFRQSLPPEQRAEYDKLYGKGAGGEGTAAAGAGLNDRQVAGVNMQREAALNYAGNITGLGRDEVERIYAEKGADGIAAIVQEKGKRWIQGAPARVIESLPGGKTLVEALNVDLLAPKNAGGAGIAMYQNPTGPITTPDFQAGREQFPGATYPLPVQAEMLRQMLRTSDQGGAPTAGGGLTPGEQAELEALRKQFGR